ncbi:DUF2808 domain-containing protein [Prochlorococcus sp. MIT 1300]|uniref:DUF2808 domain-containing protein n=1 Tax=Prochlorococcus sp. MIT 1300 TaxID=3096218 RepID=UPI002A74C6DF|nr:DUF2808 domain-containing protein [Prochlorococcus sp. MIT 1300]
MLKHFPKLCSNKIAALGLVTGVACTGLIIDITKPNQVKAIPSLLEFRWDQNKDYRKLYYWQSSRRQRDRATYYLILKPQDRRTAILKLSITVPDYFDAKITPKKLKLCEVQLGGMTSRTKCIKNISATFEVNKTQTAIDVFPKKPIPSNGSYAVVMKIFNPTDSGMFQFNALAQAPGDVPMAGYLGSWSIDID